MTENKGKQIFFQSIQDLVELLAISRRYVCFYSSKTRVYDILNKNDICHCHSTVFKNLRLSRLKGRRSIGLNSCPAVKSAFKELRHCSIRLNPNGERIESPDAGEDDSKTWSKHTGLEIPTLWPDK
ncbi:unnamed protein product [Larinioides sclopetarius]